MSATHWERVQAVFAEALEQPPERRAAYVAAAVEDQEVSREVLSLLLAHEGRGRFDSVADDLCGLRPAAASVPLANLPDRLRTALAGRYTIERELSRGGMALVFLARDLRHHRTVAIKVLRPELAVALGAERFLREIRITAGLTHPNILPLLDSGEADGFLFYVMPYVEGESLRDRVDREKQLPLDDAIQIAREVADALSHAHSHDVVHRDIKPENILLEAGHAVVADFGIARAITAAGGEQLTATGLAVGTPAYMSPEQAAGDSVLDGRSDVYALGCVLYEMLAGEPPFTGRTAESIARQHLAASPARIRVVRPTVPEPLEEAILRALAKAPADRYPTATQFAQALMQAAASEPAVGVAPHRHSSVRRLVPPALLAAVLLCSGGWWVLRRLSLAPGRIDSVVVLPLDNLSGDPQQVYFVEGMHDAIIGELAQMAGLRVISRTSAMHYKNTDKSLPEIARELDVQAALEASVLRVGDSVRVQAQLIQALPRERHLGAWTYHRHLRDVLALHSELARAIAERIAVTLSPQEKARLAAERTIDPEAYDLYVRGRFEWNKFTPEGLWRAVEYFEKAIDKAPTYALAYAGLADAYMVLPYYAPVSPREAFPKAKAAATKALELDEQLAEPHTALGWVTAVHDWGWFSAERHFKRALELNRNYALGHMFYAWFLAWMGRFDEAIAQDRRAQELDPLSPRISAHLGAVLFCARQYDGATAQYLRTIDANPNFARAYFDLGRVYIQTGRYDDAIAALRRGITLSGGGGGSAISRADLGVAHALAGDRPAAQRILDELRAQSSRQYIAPLTFARLYLALGDRDRAVRWLQTAYETRDADMVLLNVFPVWDPLRSDPRFRELIRGMRFPG